MAVLIRSGRRLLIQADSFEERALLSEAQREGRLVLDEGYYAVAQGSVVIPAAISEATALRLLVGFERAALDHLRANKRRRAFRVVR